MTLNILGLLVILCAALLSLLMIQFIIINVYILTILLIRKHPFEESIVSSKVLKEMLAAEELKNGERSLLNFSIKLSRSIPVLFIVMMLLGISTLLFK